MLIFKVVKQDGSPVKKAKVTVAVTNGGNATAITDRRGFVSSPITGGSYGKVIVNGTEAYEGSLVDLETVTLSA
ncbi:MAG: hypothetical protein KUG83_04040 [Gammaproteobacteria bacterium]|nr:hypothetical protein [Gammaproteobacteria bacterium]